MSRSQRLGAALAVPAAVVAVLTGCLAGHRGGSAVADPASSSAEASAPAAPPVRQSPVARVPSTSRPEPSPSGVSTVPPTPAPTRSTLAFGDEGPAVLELQQRLGALGYWLGEPDGEFGTLTQQAVFAIQKAAGISRDGIVGAKTRAALERGVRPTARLGDGVEIDLDRQLLLVVRGGRASVILNTSTGNGGQYTSTAGTAARAITPRGDFTVYRALDGTLTNSLGELWRPRFFHDGIAVHGSSHVPPYAASHGCARLSNAAIDMIWREHLMPGGSRVLVH